MSRRNAGRSVIGLVLEIGLIVVVVSLIPKLDLRPGPAESNAISPPSTDTSWWQAEPAARATSWREANADPVHVEQTLENASRRLLSGASDFAGRAAAGWIPPAAEQPLEAPPQQERRRF